MDRFITVFKALSDRTRLRVLASLQTAGRELCICELMDTLELAQYNISKHVKELKNAGLVRERREGRFVFYSLCEAADEFHGHIVKALEAMDETTLKEDRRRLNKRLSLRQGDKCVVTKGKGGCAC